MFRRAALIAMGLVLLSTTNVAGATKTVTVNNSGFTPKTSTVAIGNSVKWKNTSRKKHTAMPTVNWSWTAVTAKAKKTSAAITPSQAGSFPYFCSLHPKKTGTLNVAMKVSPLAGNTATYFTLTLGTVTAPGVLVHQVETRRDGGAWSLRATTNQPSIAIFFPDTGTYEIRTRLRYQLGGATSGWSPNATIQVF